MTLAAPSASAPGAATTAPRSIISPWVDLLTVGGGSILILVPLLVSGREELVFVGVGVQAWLAAMVNMPHFMASYRMVYRDFATIRAHLWATVGVPLVLLACIAFAVAASRTTDRWVSYLMIVQGGYLAWHYTGQVWGMMATYAFLDGRPFNAVERNLIRTGLRILLIWHVTWFFHWGVTGGDDLGVVYDVMTGVSALALVLGGIGFALMKVRTGRYPPVRSLVAWAALFVWYAAMARDVRAVFWVQIAHAVQYLSFPVRVELNRTRRRVRSGRRVALHMVGYAAILLAASYAFAFTVPASAMASLTDYLGTRPGQVAPMMLLAFLNIHHYFTDGVIWKLRNREVREDLFGHLGLAAAPASGATTTEKPRPLRRARRGRRGDDGA